MTPNPTDNQVIFLNGPSSSGKSSLALALQRRLDKPYLYLAEDMFFDTLPKRQLPREDYLRYGGRLYNGFTRSVRALIDCQNRVIVDTVAWSLGSLSGFVEALWDRQVFAIGLHCPLAVLEAREQARNNRSIGLARQQFDLVHKDALYNLEIDTSSMSSDACAEKIIQAMQTAPILHAFARMKQRQDSFDGRQ